MTSSTENVDVDKFLELALNHVSGIVAAAAAISYFLGALVLSAFAEGLGVAVADLDLQPTDYVFVTAAVLCLLIVTLGTLVVVNELVFGALPKKYGWNAAKATTFVRVSSIGLFIVIAVIYDFLVFSRSLGVEWLVRAGGITVVWLASLAVPAFLKRRGVPWATARLISFIISGIVISSLMVGDLSNQAESYGRGLRTFWSANPEPFEVQPLLLHALTNPTIGVVTVNGEQLCVIRVRQAIFVTPQRVFVTTADRFDVGMPRQFGCSI